MGKRWASRARKTTPGGRGGSPQSHKFIKRRQRPPSLPFDQRSSHSWGRFMGVFGFTDLIPPKRHWISPPLEKAALSTHQALCHYFQHTQAKSARSRVEVRRLCVRRASVQSHTDPHILPENIYLGGFPAPAVKMITFAFHQPQIWGQFEAQTRKRVRFFDGPTCRFRHGGRRGGCCDFSCTGPLLY